MQARLSIRRVFLRNKGKTTVVSVEGTVHVASESLSDSSSDTQSSIADSTDAKTLVHVELPTANSSSTMSTDSAVSDVVVKVPEQKLSLFRRKIVNGDKITAVQEDCSVDHVDQDARLGVDHYVNPRSSLKQESVNNPALNKSLLKRAWSRMNWKRAFASENNRMDLSSSESSTVVASSRSESTSSTRSSVDMNIGPESSLFAQQQQMSFLTDVSYLEDVLSFMGSGRYPPFNTSASWNTLSTSASDEADEGRRVPGPFSRSASMGMMNLEPIEEEEMESSMSCKKTTSSNTTAVLNRDNDAVVMQDLCTCSIVSSLVQFVQTRETCTQECWTSTIHSCFTVLSFSLFTIWGIYIV